MALPADFTSSFAVCGEGRHHQKAWPGRPDVLTSKSVFQQTEFEVHGKRAEGQRCLLRRFTQTVQVLWEIIKRERVKAL